jgi:hypothetical protein
MVGVVQSSLPLPFTHGGQRGNMPVRQVAQGPALLAAPPPCRPTRVICRGARMNSALVRVWKSERLPGRHQ